MGKIKIVKMPQVSVDKPLPKEKKVKVKQEIKTQQAPL